MVRILINQVGYISGDRKRVIVESDGEKVDSFTIIRDRDNKEVYKGDLVYYGRVERWNKGEYLVGDFSSFSTPGSYKVKVGNEIERIEISEYLVSLRLISANTAFFKAQRSSGEWDSEDRHLSFSGPRKGEMDLRGGWFDASGDHGIHLSHLSHSTWYNPQQMGLSTYFFFKGYDYVEKKKSPSYTILKKRMLDEGSWGADFLVRTHIPSGSFIRSIRRNEDLDHMDVIKGTRSIGFDYHNSSDQFSEAETKDSEIVDDTYYETSLRSGGALAIAALASASTHETISEDYSSQDYLEAAEEAYEYLVENNNLYTNDGKWNFVDYYTVLLASTELYLSTKDEKYLLDSRAWCKKMIEHTLAIREGERRFEYTPGFPFHHASDEGLPILSLVFYGEVEKDDSLSKEAFRVAEEVMRHKVSISKERVNPFNYPMEEVLDNGCVKTQFFFPHNTTVSPWWQGENARLASLSAASYLVSTHTEDESLKNDLETMSTCTLDWIMGQNPFDSSMIEGFGRNNPEYFFFNNYDYVNIPGGIVNGITSMIDDEEGIDLVMEPRSDVSDNWRWAEQWIPHVSWFMFAKCIRKE